MLQNFKSGDLSPQPIFRPSIGMATIAALSIIGVSIYTVNYFQSTEIKQSQEQIVQVPEVKTVTALGRLEPKGEVIKLSAPISAEGSRVEQLLMKEGDRVKTGQIVAILDNRDRLQAALEEAKEAVGVVQANLAQVKAGAKQGEIEAQKANIARLEVERGTEIEAQKATIARIEAERNTESTAQKATIARIEAQLENARMEYQRHQTLYQQGAISASLRDSKRLTLDSAKQQLKEARANLSRIQTSRQQQLKEARANLSRIQASRKQQIKAGTATLNSIAEVRPVDVAIASAEVRRAVAGVKRAEANLQQAYVKSPQDGQILEIFARPGELVSNDGVAEIGQNSQMYAVVEVYQSDVNKVSLGQKVRLVSDSLDSELQGTVERVGLQIQRQNVINSDPSSNIDARVVEVDVKLDDTSTQKAAKFTNLQVKAVIQL